MTVQESLKECNIDELLKGTIDLIAKSDGYFLSLPEIITGSTLIIAKFVTIVPKFDLSKKFTLMFRSDGFGPYCILKYKNYDVSHSKFNFFKKNIEMEQDQPKYSDILYLPWEQLSGLDCEFTDEVNGRYLEHLFAYFFLELSYFGFVEPIGDLVDRKLKNLLELP